LDGDDISLDDVDVGKDLTAFMSSPHFSTESHPPEEVMTSFSSKLHLKEQLFVLCSLFLLFHLLSSF
jgi:hypothetical protein